LLTACGTCFASCAVTRRRGLATGCATSALMARAVCDHAVDADDDVMRRESLRQSVAKQIRSAATRCGVSATGNRSRQGEKERTVQLHTGPVEIEGRQFEA